MNKKYKVSVIVPVYNVEKYLDKCLDSLAKQTLDNLEIIVVNDGTKDNSQKIIDKYVDAYPELFKSFIKENGGLGDARNYGLKYAEGEYIGFVDSDDWVDEKMFEIMYNHATKYEAQIVICDLFTINDGWESGHISKGYRGTNPYPEKRDFILNSLNPAHAWNKLYYYQVLEIEKFPSIWYEDIAVIPVWLSYAKKISYVQIPMYYYRQRENSITQMDRNNKTKQVIKAWGNVIETCNIEYKEEIICAVYESIVNFLYFKPEFADEFMGFLKEKETLFRNNKLIKQKLIENKIENIFEKKLIPKKIHYFWFGVAEKDEIFYKCLNSWKKYAPDFEIIEWNETNCNINECLYVKEAYEAKKWAFVSDYFRIKKIFEYGGIYVDTDVEFLSDISRLRLNNTFFAFETKDKINAAIFGSIEGRRILKQWLDTYSISHFTNKDGTLNTSYTIVNRLSDLLVKKYSICLNGCEQKIDNNIYIYSANILTCNMHDNKCIAEHHYIASWWDTKYGITSYKFNVLKDYFENISNIDMHNNDDKHNEYDQEEIKNLKITVRQFEESTCWKITKPIRILGNFIGRIKSGRG